MADDPTPILGQADTPAVDPTRNVLDLVAAAIQRQDDLREAERRHLRELAEIRAECARDERAADIRIADLRAKHGEELRNAEAARIDAIRAVDVAAVQQAYTAAEARATALAASVAAAAEAMRIATAATTGAGQVNLAAALEPVQKRMEELSRAQYEQQGQKARGAQSSQMLFAILGLVMTAIIIAVGIFAATH